MNRKVAAGAAESELRELGSRFFAFVAPAAEVTAAEGFVEALRKRYPDATHHCFAWRVGEPPVERSSDDGEPGGTESTRAGGSTGAVASTVMVSSRLIEGALCRDGGGGGRPLESAALEPGGGRLGVPTETTRWLGILGGGGG